MRLLIVDTCFFFNDTATTEIYTLSLHDALPICGHVFEVDEFHGDNDGLVLAEVELGSEAEAYEKPDFIGPEVTGDRKSTRLNSSHANISYAVFCLKKKK